MQKNLIRSVLIDIVDPHYRMVDADKEMSELQSLVKTYGGVDVVHIFQHRTRPDKSTFIGSGKVAELVEIVKQQKIQAVIINDLVGQTQLFNLTKAIWPVNPDIFVWDRIDLILNIFDKHASSSEAKLQIEIARMHHMGPRIYGLGDYFSRQAGGIGTRGLGETNIELMKRHWRDAIKVKQDQLVKLNQQHKRQLERRRENGLKSVSIVGYTNAGKTSLFNLLTKKHQKVKNELFVTLDSVVGHLYLQESKQNVIVSDTIGFIQDLPPNLIDAFKSTLMESINADLLVHVIDVSDEKMQTKIEVVEKLIYELGIGNKKKIYVFNKTDLLKDKATVIKHLKQSFLNHNPQFISVNLQEGIEELKKTLENQLV